jgi:hypothetical protein
MGYAKALGVLLRGLLIEREPMYRQHETLSTFAPTAFGLDPELAEHVSATTPWAVHWTGSSMPIARRS